MSCDEKKPINDYEKAILCLMIMRDLRGNWAYFVTERVLKVIDLAKELKWDKTVNLCKKFLNNLSEDGDGDGDGDGRYFRCDFKDYGGYENSLLQTCDKNFLSSYSNEFQKLYIEYLTYP